MLPQITVLEASANTQQQLQPSFSVNLTQWFPSPLRKMTLIDS